MVKKYHSELNTTHIRVNVADYRLLKELSVRQNISITELVRRIIETRVKVEVKAEDIRHFIDAGVKVDVKPPEEHNSLFC